MPVPAVVSASLFAAPSRKTPLKVLLVVVEYVKTESVMPEPFSTIGEDDKPVVFSPTTVMLLPLSRTIPVLAEPKTNAGLVVSAVAFPSARIPPLRVIVLALVALEAFRLRVPALIVTAGLAPRAPETAAVIVPLLSTVAPVNVLGVELLMVRFELPDFVKPVMPPIRPAPPKL